jgi:hypothetical protein
MLRQSLLPTFLAFILFAFFAIEPAVGQACTWVPCPGGADYAVGTYPDCFCNGEPVDVGVSGPQNSTCARDFQCVDNSRVGAGNWPACVCVGADNPGGGTSNPSDFQPGLGGVETCNQYYTCPPLYQMDVGDAGCVCKRGLMMGSRLRIPTEQRRDQLTVRASRR